MRALPRYVFGDVGTACSPFLGEEIPPIFWLAIPMTGMNGDLLVVTL